MPFEEPASLRRRLSQLDTVIREANDVREQDRLIIEKLLQNFHNNGLEIGIGFERAYGSVLSGDYFNFMRLGDGSLLFVFADISGHGLKAYTHLIRFNAAVILAIREMNHRFRKRKRATLVSNILEKFTSLMVAIGSDDFVSALFAFIDDRGDELPVQFFSRGMHFPLVLRHEKSGLATMIDLNEKLQAWQPRKSVLAGKLFFEHYGEKYYKTPPCDFRVQAGDRLVFYSDGLIEAAQPRKKHLEFGNARLKELLIENIDQAAQKTVDNIFYSVHKFIKKPQNLIDDMTAVIIDFKSR